MKKKTTIWKLQGISLLLKAIMIYAFTRISPMAKH